MVEDSRGRQTLPVANGTATNLMEVLKAAGYHIPAICGGMGICATCHIRVLEGAENLSAAGTEEWNMLETLPAYDEGSRLACQIPISPALEGLVIQIM